MDFIRVAPFVDIWPPFMSVRLNSKRDLPVSKLILPSMVMVLLETSVVCISNPAEKAWLSPNSLPVAPPKCGPPGGPDCEYAGRSPRQITAEASIENCFFIVREWVFARFNLKCAENPIFTRAVPASRQAGRSALSANDCQAWRNSQPRLQPLFSSPQRP